MKTDRIPEVGELVLAWTCHQAGRKVTNRGEWIWTEKEEGKTKESKRVGGSRGTSQWIEYEEEDIIRAEDHRGESGWWIIS